MPPRPVSVPRGEPAAERPVLTYARVSREEQATPDKASLTQQRERTAALAAQLGLRVTRHFADAGLSGGSDDRPAFQAMVAFAQAHPQPARRPGLVLVLSDSRWGRWEDPEVAAYWRVWFSRHGWRVRYVEHDDTQDKTTRTVMRALHASQATIYRDQLRKTAERGARGTAEQGYWQNEAPLGYRRLAIDAEGRERVLAIGQRKSDDERSRLTPGPAEEVAIVRWCFETYASGAVSLGQMVQQLLARWPSKRWSRGTLHAVLTNPAYTGTVLWCRKTNDPEQRVDALRRDPADWVRVEDAHPAIVDHALFSRVEQLLARNRRQTSPTPGVYLLSGLMTCARCGEHYIGGGGRRGPPEDPDRYRVYVDAGAQKRVCAGVTGTVTRRLVENAVLAVVSRLVASDAMQQLLAEVVDEELAHAAADDTGAEAARAARRATLTAQRDRLVRAVAQGTVLEAEAAGTLTTLRRELEAVRAEGERARFRRRQGTAIRAERARLIALTRDLPQLLQQLEGRQRRELLLPWLDTLVFDKDTRELEIAVAPSGIRADAIRAGLVAPAGAEWTSPDMGEGGAEAGEGDDDPPRLVERITLPWPSHRGRRLA